jgi:hypothetical protein
MEMKTKAKTKKNKTNRKKVRTSFLRNGCFFARWKLGHFHSEIRAQFALRLLEDGLEVSGALFAEDFDADVVAADGKA